MSDHPEAAAAEPLEVAGKETLVAAPQGAVIPRVWPTAVILAIQLAVMHIPPWLAPGTAVHFMSMLLGPIIGVALLAIWWLFFSRVPWKDRLVGLGLFAAGAAVTQLSVHESMKMGTLMFVLPWATTAMVLTLLVTWWIPWEGRRWLVVLAMAGVAGYSTLLRVKGLDGDLVADVDWRWRATAEDHFLAAVEGSDAADVSVVVPRDSSPGDWPGFRGASREGRLPGVTFATDWQQRPPREVWRRSVGPGWSSFCVVGDLLFTQEQRGPDEVVVCYRADTGDQVWVSRVAARFEEVVGGPGPRATPTFHQGRLYTLGATGVLQCLDPATGDSLWRRELVTDTGAKTPDWGFASSPLIVGDLVIVFSGAGGNKSVVAYDASSGELAWSSGEGTHSYSSAHLTTIAEVDQVLMCSDVGLHSYDPVSGKMLWRHEWALPGMARIVQPLVVSGKAVVIGTGYGYGTRRVDVGRGGDAWKVDQQWTTPRLKPYFNDFVEHEGHVYGFDGRLFTCVNTTTGKTMWKGGRYGHGQVLLVTDMSMLLIVSEKGEVALVKATPEKFREVARFKALAGKTWNHPVIAHGKLFVRNGEEAACYQLEGP